MRDMNASEPQMKQRKHVDDSKAAALWRLQDQDGATYSLAVWCPAYGNPGLCKASRNEAPGAKANVW